MSETSPVEPQRRGMSRAEARERLAVVIFGTSTPAGRAFDVALLLLIVASVLAVMLESVEAIGTRFGTTLRVLDWVFTVLFLAEYSVRIWVARHRMRYVFSFFGIVDLLSILPWYIQARRRLAARPHREGG